MVTSAFVRAASFLALFGFCEFASAADGFVERQWIAHGMLRIVLIQVPTNAAKTPSPVVFVFHDEVDSMREAAARWRIHELWPEAIVVYPGRSDSYQPRQIPFEWQDAPGGADYDLSLFDIMFEALGKEFRIDLRRVYAMGQSTGGRFVYLLWSQRANVLTAVAPCAAVTSSLMPTLTPKPVFVVAGMQDQDLKFLWQKNVIVALLRRNECDASTPLGLGLVTHASKIGAPVATLIHGSGHELPANAPAAIVEFFRQQVKP